MWAGKRRVSRRQPQIMVAQIWRRAITPVSFVDAPSLAAFSGLVRAGRRWGLMSFGQAISTCFGKFVTFRGHTRQTEYWYFVLFGILLGIPAGIIDTVMATARGNTAGGRRVTGLLSLV